MTGTYQPLDVGINAPFKANLKRAYHEWRKERTEVTAKGYLRKPTRQDFFNFVSKAWEAIRPEKIENAFVGAQIPPEPTYMLSNKEVLVENDKQLLQFSFSSVEEDSKLNYTEAALYDVQRLATVTPLGIPHTNFAPMKVDGHDIPARTLLQANIHPNPKNWAHPDEWHPEHFLNDQNELFVPKAFMPFSVGKRACLGESLGKMELFLYFTNIIQQFEVQADLRELKRAENQAIGIFNTPLPFNIRLVP
ncbi:hypothetical protein RvY_04451 [Ramazzottius varieornatus]|uniref:DDE-1 domain-containing protein n=1 Tax=Ramazzottius varieornatus TaxID=947166 RepID=A0A1D1UV18_RAMVA|nr:hypothetical protein RvY_04451 [Ramazzottius varieornatus]